MKRVVRRVEKRIEAAVPKAARKSKRTKTGRAFVRAGRALGGLYSSAGAGIGAAAGSLMSRITGNGAYRVSRNTILSGAVPSFSRGADGVRVCHREFLGDVVGSTAFALTSYDINPGLSYTFPWLSTLCQGFEEYDMHGLVFEYRPTSGTAVSNTSAALGVVVLATNYDVLEPVFYTKQEMESSEFSTSCVPFESSIHPVECARGRNPLETYYLRSGLIAPGADQRMYDMGLFQLGVSGMQTGYTVGELWVSYDVSLLKPRISSLSSAGIIAPYSIIRENPALSASNSVVFGTAPTASASSTLIAGPGTAGNTIVIAPPGVYLVTSTFVAKTGTMTSTTPTSVGANINAINIFDDSSVNNEGVFSSTKCVQNAVIQVTAYGTGSANTLTYTSSGTWTGTATVVITLLPTQTSY